MPFTSFLPSALFSSILVVCLSRALCLPTSLMCGQVIFRLWLSKHSLKSLILIHISFVFKENFRWKFNYAKQCYEFDGNCSARLGCLRHINFCWWGSIPTVSWSGLHTFIMFCNVVVSVYSHTINPRPTTHKGLNQDSSPSKSQECLAPPHSQLRCYTDASPPFVP